MNPEPRFTHRIAKVYPAGAFGDSVFGPNNLVSTETWTRRGFDHIELYGWARPLTPYELEHLDDELAAAGWVWPPVEAEPEVETVVEPEAVDEPVVTKAPAKKPAAKTVKKAVKKPATE